MESRVQNKLATSGSMGSEFDLRDLFKVLKKYQYSIIFIVFIAASIAAVMAYLSENVYQAKTTILIKSEKGSQDDFISLALGQESSNLDNDKEFLRSRFIISKAVENLNINTRYFKTHNYKTTELYKASPFIVKADHISDRVTTPFAIIPVDDKHFRLLLKPRKKSQLMTYIRSLFISTPTSNGALEYDEIHMFGEPISTPWFNLSVQKVHDLTAQSYSFTISSDEAMSKFIASRLSISTLAKSTILRLSFQDSVAQRAEEIVNAIAETYIQETIDFKTQSSEKALEFLDTQLDAINKTLQNSAATLQRYKATNIVVDIDDKAQMTAGKLAEFESQRYELDMQLGVLESTLDYIQTNDDISGIDLGVAEREASSTINLLIQKIQEASSLRNSLLVDFTELHPDVQKVTQQLTSLRNSLVKTIQSSIRSAKDRKFRLTEIINKHTKQMKNLPKQQRDLSRLTRNFMVNEKIYSFLLEKRAEMAIIQSSTVSETRIIDRALKPKSPIKPKRLSMVIIGSIFGLVLGVLLALWRNFRDDTLGNIEDIKALTDMPIYGVLPHFKSIDSSEQFGEAMRVVRTNLEFLQNHSKTKIITITSSISSEGKSTISSKLAQLIAKSHKRVVLLDLDMRRARVHERYNLSNTIGMSTLLSSSNSLDEVVHVDVEENLDIITAGPVPPNPSELILAPVFQDIVSMLSADYDYIIFDSPPVGLVTDAMILMKLSDINLFILRANLSKKEFVKNINRFVHEQKLSSAGIVLNGAQMSKTSGYGYGYGYGKK